MSKHSQQQPAHDSQLDRRSFVRVVSASAVAAPLAASALPALAAPTRDLAAETSVKELFASFSEAQKKEVCFKFDHPKRTEINANWHITKQKIGSDFYTNQQRELIDRVIRGITSEEGYDRFQKQMLSDNKGVQNYAMAIFGNPESGKFQWELTGRHLTMRADGDSVPGRAFGGPLVYGHGVANPKRSLFGYQTEVANKVFQSLDTKQREKALLKVMIGEDEVKLQGADGLFEGISASELSSDQLDLLENTLKTILAPYREADVEEAMTIIKDNGGLEKLKMAFYSKDDLLNDKVWDLWRIESPNLVCHFRGAPHVHAFINIGVKA